MPVVSFGEELYSFRGKAGPLSFSDKVWLEAEPLGHEAFLNRLAYREQVKESTA